MKKILLLPLLAGLIASCKSPSGTKEQITEDSMAYYPPTPGQMDKSESRRYFRAVSGIIDSTFANRTFNGGILVAKDGNIIYEKYAGLKDLRKMDSINAGTSFHIASTSKTFTATAILKLVQEKKLSLNDSLQSFFPGIAYPSVTVKMLLCHRSGIPNYVYFIGNSKRDKKQMVFNNDVIDYLIKEKPKPEFAAGKRFNYSNTNYVLLASIIEKITGISFPEYLQKNIFQPLQMKNSFVFTWKDSAHVTMSFNGNGSLWDYDYLDGTYGDKNIYSTPRDLLKWDQALYTEQLISKPLLDSAFTPYSFEKPSVHNYGLGWRMMLLPGNKKIIYHNGRWHGFNSAFTRLTDEKAVIIVLGNRLSWLPYHVAFKCYNVFGDYFPVADAAEEENGTKQVKDSVQIKTQVQKIKKIFPGKRRRR